MNCADVEILLAEYVDGILHGEPKSALENHLAGCAACAALAHDAAGAVAFLERAADVEAPPELINRILFEVSNGASRTVVKPPLARRLFGSLLGKWLEPILQPRFAMGMAMTVLSFGMMFQFTSVRQLTPADLDPVRVWSATEERVTRWWDRGVKYYQSVRLVFEIQTRLKEWSEEQPNPDANKSAPAPAAGGESK
ncbi:MAG: zf-HC2 domain-containing protein [Bryobacteraceae bacterium]